MCKYMKGSDEYIKKCGMCKECRSIRGKKYREDNYDKIVEKDKKHYKKCKERKNKQSANYYANNKEKIKEQRRITMKNVRKKHVSIIIKT